MDHPHSMVFTLIISVLESKAIFSLSGDTVEAFSSHATSFNDLHTLVHKGWDAVILYHGGYRRAKVSGSLSRFLWHIQQSVEWDQPYQLYMMVS